MKQYVSVPVIAAFLLAASSGVEAEGVKGTAAAKAQVEETAIKEKFKTEIDSHAFQKEATQDTKKVDAVTEVKALEAKDKTAAPTETKAFKKEAIVDKNKTIY